MKAPIRGLWFLCGLLAGVSISVVLWSSEPDLSVRALWRILEQEEEVGVWEEASESPVQQARYNNHPPLKPLRKFRHLSQDYPLRRRLLVAVLTRCDHLPTRAAAVFNTWGSTVDKLLFFVGEDCDYGNSELPLVRLPGVPDNVYPPLLKAFAALSYIYKEHVNEFQWFVRADDDVYMNTGAVERLLGQMDSSQLVYMGASGTGRKGDLSRLSLQPGRENYCLGGPGVFLSRAALAKIGPHLKNCLSAALTHSSEGGGVWNDDDVEIGRCFNRKIDLKCSQSKEAVKLFHFDYNGLSHNPVTLWTTPHLRGVLTLHAIKDPVNMLAVHAFYTSIQQESALSKWRSLGSQLQSLTRELPVNMRPPINTSGHCPS